MCRRCSAQGAFLARSADKISCAPGFKGNIGSEVWVANTCATRVIAAALVDQSHDCAINRELESR
jgi:hypothetical protein